MGRKKRLAFSLFPSSIASYFFSLFLLKYRAGAPAKDYVHHFPCFFTKTATVLKGFRVLVTKWLWLHFRTLFHGKQVRNDWEICWFQLSFMVLYLIWNEISRFWFVKTRKRQIDIELFCSLLSGHCVDQFYPANKKKTSKFGQGQLIMKFKHQKENRYKRKSKVHFPLLAHLLQYWVVWYALFLIFFFGLQDTKETVIWNVGEIGDTSALLT